MVNNENMKKLIILCVILILSTVSCGSEGAGKVTLVLRIQHLPLQKALLLKKIGLDTAFWIPGYIPYGMTNQNMIWVLR